MIRTGHTLVPGLWRNSIANATPKSVPEGDKAIFKEKGTVPCSNWGWLCWQS